VRRCLLEPRPTLRPRRQQTTPHRWCHEHTMPSPVPLAPAASPRRSFRRPRRPRFIGRFLPIPLRAHWVRSRRGNAIGVTVGPAPAGGCRLTIQRESPDAAGQVHFLITDYSAIPAIGLPVRSSTRNATRRLISRARTADTRACSAARACWPVCRATRATADRENCRVSNTGPLSG
jgi:hypothetical protein